jgi:hypothetical protein
MSREIFFSIIFGAIKVDLSHQYARFIKRSSEAVGSSNYSPLPELD